MIPAIAELTAPALFAAGALVAAGIRQWRGHRPAKPTKGDRLLWTHAGCAARFGQRSLSPLNRLPWGRLLGQGLLWAVPLMCASGGLLGLAARPQRTQALRHAAGAALVALGVAGIALALAQDDGLLALLCAPR